MTGGRTAVLVRKRMETPDVASLVFRIEEGEGPPLVFLPGQHVLVEAGKDRSTLRRPYSISDESSSGGTVRITVKRVPDGRVSTHLVDELDVGASVRLGLPGGELSVRPHPWTYATYYAFAAGIGITPIRSIIGAVLEGEPHSHVFLGYGNRDSRSIVFLEELQELEERFQGRFSTVHFLSRMGWLGPRVPGVPGGRVRAGRIDEAGIRRFLQAHPPVSQAVRYLVCGPDGFNRDVRGALLGLQVRNSDILCERFGSPLKPSADEAETLVEATCHVEGRGGLQGPVNVSKGETLLHALRQKGIEAPSSCETGICGFCKASLTEGSVTMRVMAGLESGEAAEGAVLLCQARPTSSQLSIRIDHHG